MRIWFLSLAALAAAACATAPPPISTQQRQRFQTTVAAARLTATPRDCPSGDTQLRMAESDFYYAENSPMNPARAARMAVQAQQEAEAAIAMCRVGGGALEASR